MSMFNVDSCYLCLYASYDDSSIIIKVMFDYQFAKNMLGKIKSNYLSKMVHVLCEADSEGTL